jgi:ribosomal protein S18 acetylase RimI-like enzyme
MHQGPDISPCRTRTYLFDRVTEIEPSDAQRYRELRLRGLQDHPEAFGEIASTFEAKTTEEIAQQMVTQRSLGGFTLVALSKTGDMIGTASLGLNAPGKFHHRASLWGMYVIPEARGQNVGRFLIQDLLERARQIDGIEQVHLAVTSSNISALKLYKRMGFVTYGIDPRALKLDGQYFDECLMVRLLAE